MSRGFEIVNQENFMYGTKVVAHGVEQIIYPQDKLPIRSDAASAGYDFYTPIKVTLLPGETKTVWTNVKAYMGPDEVLTLYVRSSVGIKKGVVLANGTGIVDASYYENESNDGNIGIALKNTTGQSVIFEAGERIAQGIFTKYLIIDEDEVMNEKRTGGIGSSGS